MERDHFNFRCVPVRNRRKRLETEALCPSSLTSRTYTKSGRRWGSPLALARNAVDAEFFKVCRATRGNFGTGTNSRFQAALEEYDNACRKALRLNLHDWDANADSIWNFCEDGDIKSIRAEVGTLRGGCTAEKVALKELQSEVIGWHRASVVDDSWLPRLKYQSHTVLSDKKMGKLFDVNSTAIKARKVVGALIATTAAQRELYRAYDQAHFGGQGKFG